MISYRKISFFVVLFAFSFISCDLPGWCSPSPTAPIKIGAITSLTGPAAEQGRNWMQGAQLAIDSLNSQGTRAELIVEDDGTSASRSNSAFQKLANIDKVQGIVGGTWDFTGEAAYPLAQKFHIPFITPTNPVELLDGSPSNNRLIFTLGLSLAATKTAMHDFLVSRKPATISMVVPNVPFGTRHADLMAEVAKELNIQILSRNEVDYSGYQDTLRSLALKMSQENPSLIFCLTDYSGLNVFIEELERLRLKPIVLTAQHLDDAILMSKVPERFSNAFGIYPPLPPDDFIKRFQEKFQSLPKVYAAQGYDAVRFLAKALLEKADLTKPGFSMQGLTSLLKVQEKTRALSEDPAVIFGLSESGKFGSVLLREK